MKKYLQLTVLLTAIFLSSKVTNAQMGTMLTTNDLPHTFTFETGTNDSLYFSFANGNDGWFFGSATAQEGSRSLYISNDNGMTNAYSNWDAISYAWMTIDIAEAGAYEINFDWKGVGSGTMDFMYLYLAPNNVVPVANSNLSGATQIGTRFGREFLWQNFDTVINFSVSDTGVYKLIFKWNSGNMDCINPPIAIDNLYLNKYTCPSPNNLVISGVTTSGATVRWSPMGSETSWFVYLNGEMIGNGPVADSSYTFSELEADSEYFVRVYANCGGGDISSALYGSFRTLCDSYNDFYYRTGFEGLPMGTLPDCWCPIQRGTGTISDRGVVFPAVLRNCVGAFSGSGYLSFKSTSSETETVVLPNVLYYNQDLQLTFYASTFDVNFLLEVGVVEEDTSGSSVLIVVDTVNLDNTIIVGSSPSSNPFYRFYRVLFDGLNGNDTRIFLRTTCLEEDASYSLSIDDLRVEPVNHPVLSPFDSATISVAPNTPITIRDTLMTGTDVYYQWSSSMNNVGNADLYDFGTDSVLLSYYSLGIDTLTLVASSAIGSDTQILVIYVIDTTPIDTFPYYTSFENGEDISWTFTNGHVGLFVGSAVAYTGSRSLYASDDNGFSTEVAIRSSDRCFASRKFHFSQVGDYTLRGRYMSDMASFGVNSLYFGQCDDLQVMCNTSSMRVTNFQDADMWTPFEVNLHVSDTGIYTLMFSRSSSSVIDIPLSFALDDLSISQCTCYPVSTLSVSNVTAHEADISWTPVNNEGEWWISIDGETGYSVYDDTIHLAGLSSYTRYHVSVSAICASGDTSLPVTISFCTAVACPQVKNLTVSVVKDTIAIVSWSPGGEETEWIIVLNRFDTIHVSDTVYTLTDLTPLTSYRIEVYADCGDDSLSFGLFRVFRTPCGAPYCDITIEMRDAYGDGWNWDYIALWQSEFNYGFYTLEAGGIDTQTMSVCPNLPIIVTVYVSDTSLPDGMSATIINGAGIPIFSFSDHTLSPGIDGDTLAIIYAPCDFCLPPNSIRQSSSTDSTLTFTWIPYSESVATIVSFDGGPWQSVTTSTFTATGLNSGTDYTLAIRSICSPSDSSIIIYINGRTSGATSAIDDVNGTAVTLYPNPSSGKVVLSGLMPGTQMSLLDISGRMVGSFVINNSKFEFDVSNLSKGTYFVRVADTHTLTTIKLMVD